MLEIICLKKKKSILHIVSKASPLRVVTGSLLWMLMQKKKEARTQKTSSDLALCGRLKAVTPLGITYIMCAIIIVTEAY